MKTIIFLYIIIFGYNDTPKREYRVEMPSFKICYESIKNHESKISNGNDSENGIILFCGTGKTQTRDAGMNFGWENISED